MPLYVSLPACGQHQLPTLLAVHACTGCPKRCFTYVVKYMTMIIFTYILVFGAQYLATVYVIYFSTS